MTAVDGPENSQWPECIQCDSGETTVVPKTGEWTCGDCGRQWTWSEVNEDGDGAENIPNEIEHMLRVLGGLE